MSPYWKMKSFFSIDVHSQSGFERGEGQLGLGVLERSTNGTGVEGFFGQHCPHPEMPDTSTGHCENQKHSHIPMSLIGTGGELEGVIKSVKEFQFFGCLKIK